MARDPEKLAQYRKTYREKKAKEEAEKPKRGSKGRPESERIRDGEKGWGRKVAAKRKSLQYTQEEFAAIIGIGQPTLCNLEKGTYRASPLLKEKIEKLFFRHAGLGTPRRGAPKA